MPIHSHVDVVNKDTVLILFGATGDLVARKIIPALHKLYENGHLPRNFHVIGFSRRNLTSEDFRSYIKDTVLKHTVEPDFLKLFSYIPGNFEDSAAYILLDNKIATLEKDWQACSSRLYYLAVPPEHYLTIFENLSASKFAGACTSDVGWSRIIVEKPFGRDLGTSKALDAKLATLFKEEQIYRVDHYLGKEVLQNILYFRFSNNLLENNWDSSLIEKIDITFLESEGIGSRGNFYDGIGTLRDVGQNHMLQMLALTTMSDPLEFNTENVRENRAKILESLKILSHEEIAKNTSRGQCIEYAKDASLKSPSTTETYFKIHAFLDNNKWYGVPITLEGGKYLNKTDKKVVVTFRGKFKNKIIFDLDGADMGIYMEMYIKKPGISNDLEKRTFSLPICDDPTMCEVANAYELLLLECIEGNQTFFVSTKEVNAAWRFVDPIIKAWQKDSVPLQKYAAGQELVSELI